MAWQVDGDECGLAKDQDEETDANKTGNTDSSAPTNQVVGNGVVFHSDTVTIGEESVVFVVGIAISTSTLNTPDIGLERPVGTSVSDHSQETNFAGGTTALSMFVYTTWELLDAGVYTYSLVNRRGSNASIYYAGMRILTAIC